MIARDISEAARYFVFYRLPEQARVAHEMLEGAPHKRGKIVLSVTG